MHFFQDKFRSAVPWVRRLAGSVSEDRVTLYAAQASFFVIISVVPFLSLLISFLSFFIPADVQGLLGGVSLSPEVSELVGSLLYELQHAPAVSLFSFSAVTALWSASKGVGAIRAGVETVYQARSDRGLVREQAGSLVSTLLFIALILASVVLLLFGDFILGLLRLAWVTELVLRWRTPLLILFMCLLFTALYTAAARRSGLMRASPLAHLPGAVFASVGWRLFSYFYSLYIRFFPNASYLYGSLAAICLIMLWLYFCMIILLLGAEINKSIRR